MALAKQIEAIGLENSNFSNGDANSGLRYTINIQDVTYDIEPEFYTGNPYDVAISGKVRQNLRGYRFTATINFNASIQQQRMLNLFDDLVDAFVDNNVDSIWLRPDANETSIVEVVLEAGSYSSIYENTVGSFRPSLTFVSLNIFDEIPSYLEAP